MVTWAGLPVSKYNVLGGRMYTYASSKKKESLEKKTGQQPQKTSVNLLMTEVLKFNPHLEKFKAKKFLKCRLNTTSSFTTKYIDISYGTAKTQLPYSKMNYILFLHYIILKQEMEKNQLIMF